MSCDSDWDADFRQPAIDDWYALKKFFDRYHVHIYITEALAGGGVQCGMRIQVTYKDQTAWLLDTLADDEYAEYYTLGSWIGKDDFLKRLVKDGTQIPPQIVKVLKKLAKVLNSKDQIEVSLHNLYVHGVPMVSLPQGLSVLSFETEEPLARHLGRER